jgi:hypothetical protein
MISLDDINRITLRVTFLPWVKENCRQMGITLPKNWNPSDEELERLAERVTKAFGDQEA